MPGSPGMLAPAGRAPGGATGDGEGTGHGQASDLAQAIGCEDVEDQQHLPSVNEQLTCRRGTERVYILTFTTVAQRDTYLDQALQIAHGGWGVLGPTWMIHVEDAATAEELGRQLQGTVRQDA